MVFRLRSYIVIVCVSVFMDKLLKAVLRISDGYAIPERPNDENQGNQSSTAVPDKSD